MSLVIHSFCKHSSVASDQICSECRYRKQVLSSQISSEGNTEDNYNAAWWIWVDFQVLWRQRNSTLIWLSSFSYDFSEAVISEWVKSAFCLEREWSVACFRKLLILVNWGWLCLFHTLVLRINRDDICSLKVTPKCYLSHYHSLASCPTLSTQKQML